MVGNGSGQVECSDLKIKQPLGAKKEIFGQIFSEVLKLFLLPLEISLENPSAVISRFLEFLFKLD